MPKLMYCVGTLLKAYDYEGFDLVRRDIPREEVFNSFPTTDPILAFEYYDDVKRYAASIMPDFISRSRGTGGFISARVPAIFFIYVDSAFEGEEKIIDCPRNIRFHNALVRVRTFEVPRQYLLEIFRAQNPTFFDKGTYLFYSSTEEKYAKAWNEEKESSPAKRISNMIGVYQHHRWFNRNPKHSEQAEKIQTLIKQPMSQHDLYNLFLAEKRKLTDVDQKHDYANFIHVVLMNLNNPVTFRQTMVSQLPFTLAVLNLISDYGQLPKLLSHQQPSAKAVVVNDAGGIEEILTESPSLPPLSYRNRL